MEKRKMSNLFSVNNIKLSQNKTAIGAVVMILLMAISVFAVAVPKTTAQAIPPGINIPQWTYINAFPPTVGVGQPISVFLWTANLPPTGSGAYGDRWTGMYVVVTKPDGTNQTLGPVTSDPVGTIFLTFTPDQTGND
jgi:hypothetical protein